MSGTRSLSRAAPVTDRAAKPALLVVAHGDRGGRRDDQLAHAVVRRLHGQDAFASVNVCFLSKEPKLQTVVTGLHTDNVWIYPLFMSDGYFVRKAIPRALELGGLKKTDTKRAVRLLKPFGLRDDLPALVVHQALQIAKERQLVLADCQLLLAAHGSKHDKASCKATDHVAQTLRQRALFAAVETSFLEEAPFLDDQVAAIKGPVIVVGLFAGGGMHGGSDLPEAIAASGRQDVHLAPSFAESTDLAVKIAGEIAQKAREFEAPVHSIAS